MAKHMRLTKIFNNSIVGAQDEKGKEVIVIGRGIGFRSKPGDVIPPAAIDKVFTLSSKYNEKFAQLLEEIPYEHIRVSDEIIVMAKGMLDSRFSENIYITLTDHISYAIERHQQGMIVNNALLWEIRQFYDKEFSVGKKAVEMINQRLGMELGDDEAGFIALHFVNAMLGTSMRIMPEITEFIRNTLAIVRDYFQMAVDEDSHAFRRFATHLRYLGQRVFKPGDYEQNSDAEFDEVIRRKYPEAYGCAEEIAEHIRAKYAVELSGDDKGFLTAHIKRLTSPKIPAENRTGNDN